MALTETAQLLGNVGEFVSALAVVATLFYLAVQVRHGRAATEANTRSLDESRRLARAQTYQARASTSYRAYMATADSGGMAPILVKYAESGFEALAPVEQERLRQRALAMAIWFDNMLYQYEQGYLDPEFYESTIRPTLRRNAQLWRDAGTGFRPSFRRELEEISSGSL